MPSTRPESRGADLQRWAAHAALAGLSLLAALPAQAGSGNDRAIRALATLRYVDRLVVVDVGSMSDRRIWSKRAAHSYWPLTPLQLAIANNPAVVEAINRTVWSLDLKSVYAARIEGYTVYLYEGEPPPS